MPPETDLEVGDPGTEYPVRRETQSAHYTDSIIGVGKHAAHPRAGIDLHDRLAPAEIARVKVVDRHVHMPGREPMPGARGLRTVVEEILLDVMYEAPSLPDIRKCVVSQDTVVNRRRPLLITESGRVLGEDPAGEDPPLEVPESA